MKILLVGGGITSAVTGMFLRKMLPESNITLWDKAKGSGGRMTTSRCPVDRNCTADIGAQYISTTDDIISSNSDIYSDLLAQGILEPLNIADFKRFKPQANTKHFVVSNGTGFLVKHFMQKASLNEIKFSYHVESISREKEKWIVETKSGEKEDFNVVILTMPVPQVFLLRGTFQNELAADVVDNLRSVKYSSRYVLVLYFVEKLKEDWKAQFIDNHPVFRYVSIDNMRRNRPNNPFAVVFHSSVSFGTNHIEDSIPYIEAVMLEHAKLMFPDWPNPKSIKCQKWRYSQVMNPYENAPGCVVVSANPPLLIGGDGFIGSGFDNCVTSSRVMCDKINHFIKRQT